jgi:hypothetical protein
VPAEQWIPEFQTWLRIPSISLILAAMRAAIVDTGPLVAFLDRAERNHRWVIARIEELNPSLPVCEPALAENNASTGPFPRAQNTLFGLLENGALRFSRFAATSLRASEARRTLGIASPVMRPGRPSAQRQRTENGKRGRLDLLLDDFEIARRLALLDPIDQHAQHVDIRRRAGANMVDAVCEIGSPMHADPRENTLQLSSAGSFSPHLPFAHIVRVALASPQARSF